MMMIEILDISHWQETIDWEKLKKSGVKGIYIKFSQGTSYKDPKAFEHYTNAKRANLKVGSYHFVTNSNGIEQYNWFMSCMGDLKFDFRPMLDCEAYQSYGYSSGYEESEVFPVKELRYGRLNEAEALKMGNILGYSYPTEAQVDVIGRRLAGFQGFDFPSIYTNYSSGNVIFKSASMKRYPIHIANWGVKTPLLPNVWKGEKWYIWQDNVVDGTPYGVVGKVDHNVWGKKYPFPEAVDPEPNPEPPTIELPDELTVVIYPKGIKYSGTVKRSVP